LFLVHQIYLAFKQGKEVRVVYLDISKGFDCVWHRGLLKKLESLGICGSSLHWFESYLQDRMQQCCSRGSIIGMEKIILLFLIYVNDITDNLESKPFVYADDTTIYIPLIYTNI
jgi:hypothetical protein